MSRGTRVSTTTAICSASGAVWANWSPKPLLTEPASRRFTALGDAEAAYGVVSAADAEASLSIAERDQLNRAAGLAETRYRAGLASFLEVLEARRAADASGERAAAALGRAARARIVLWQALGGEPVA